MSVMVLSHSDKGEAVANGFKHPHALTLTLFHP